MLNYQALFEIACVVAWMVTMVIGFWFVKRQFASPDSPRSASRFTSALRQSDSTHEASLRSLAILHGSPRGKK